MSLDDKVESKINDLKIDFFDENGKKKSQATLLIELGQKNKLFHDNQGDGFAEVRLDNRVNATFKIRSKDFKNYLSHELFKLTGQGANSNAVNDAISTLEAVAKFKGQEHIVATRLFNSGENLFIDSGDDARRILSLNNNGWKYTAAPSMYFIRKNGMLPLPVPEKQNGGLNLLKKYVNVLSNEFPLVLGWILCSLSGVKPYPILILQGEQGTRKSTTSRVIRDLIDPSSVPLRSPPKDPRDLLVSAANTHLVVLDNLSGINAKISDCLCRLSTGGGHDVRALFTDDDQCLIDLQKPILVNGIDDVASRPDLAERSLIVNLPVIADKARQSESEFWRDFKRDRPKIFAALLDAVVSGFKYKDAIKLEEKPRMADATTWITACERGLGLEGDFIEAHRENQTQAAEHSIDASPVGYAIKTLVDDSKQWIGTPTELFNIIVEIVGDRQSRSRAFPQSPKGLFNVIKRLIPSFRKLGIHIEKDRDNNARFYKIVNTGFYPSHPSQVSPTRDTKACSVTDSVTDVTLVTDSVTDVTLVKSYPSRTKARDTRACSDSVTDVTLVTDKKPLYLINGDSNDKEAF